MYYIPFVCHHRYCFLHAYNHYLKDNYLITSAWARCARVDYAHARSIGVVTSLIIRGCGYARQAFGDCVLVTMTSRNRLAVTVGCMKNNRIIIPSITGQV